MIRIKVNHARVQNEYFELLNPCNKDGKYKKNEALIESIKEEAAPKKKPRKNVKTPAFVYKSASAKKFFNHITKHLKDILLASSNDNPYANHAYYLYNKICFNSDKEAIKKFFIKRYKNLRANDNIMKFFQEVTQIHVCPYCNINHTYSVEIIEGGKQTDETYKALFQLDHFYDKATYPYLALSFYNLVPSCSTCNTNFKGSKELELNPYISSVEDEYIFRTKLKSADYFAYKPDSFEIKLSQTKNPNSNFETNKKVLGLEARYALHKAEVIDLIKKGIIYNESYLASLYEQYRDTVFSSEQEVKQLVLGNYLHPEDFHKRPLSKLTRDIAQELGLL